MRRKTKKGEITLVMKKLLVCCIIAAALVGCTGNEVGSEVSSDNAIETVSLDLSSDKGDSSQEADTVGAADEATTNTTSTNSEVVATTNNEDTSAAADEADNTADLSGLITAIKNSSEKASFEKLYTMLATCNNTPEISGEWHRTDVHSSLPATVKISSVTDDGFDFSIEAQYYFHTGELDGHAYFVSENCAVCKVDEYVSETQYVAFVLENGNVNVYASAESGEMGLGANVFLSGAYTYDKPVYTNANILNETYSQAQLDALKSTLTSSYYDNFVFSTETGVVQTETDNGTTTVDVFVPTDSSYGYTAIIKNDSIVSVTFNDGKVFELN